MQAVVWCRCIVNVNGVFSDLAVPRANVSFFVKPVNSFHSGGCGTLKTSLTVLPCRQRLAAGKNARFIKALYIQFDFSCQPMVKSRLPVFFSVAALPRKCRPATTTNTSQSVRRRRGCPRRTTSTTRDAVWNEQITHWPKSEREWGGCRFSADPVESCS